MSHRGRIHLPREVPVPGDRLDEVGQRLLRSAFLDQKQARIGLARLQPGGNAETDAPTSLSAVPHRRTCGHC